MGIAITKYNTDEVLVGEVDLVFIKDGKSRLVYWYM